MRRSVLLLRPSTSNSSGARHLCFALSKSTIIPSVPMKLPEPDVFGSGEPLNTKARGFELYHEILKSAKFVVAPMVDASELAWRILSRYYGAQLCYTPMIHSALFAEPKNAKYRLEQFDLRSNEEGAPDLDRPLIAQFCSNDPATFLEASKIIAGCPDSPSCKVDGIDLNLGCPQGIARKGKYGAFLMDHLDLVDKMISHMHQHSSVPITAKYRCFEDPQQTANYTKRLIRAGAQILIIHGRTREQKGQFTGLADWSQIKSVVGIAHDHQTPIFGNGNILIAKDTLDMISQTEVDGVMSAEGNLYNPAIFATLNPHGLKSYRDNLPQKFKTALKQVEEEYANSDGSLGSPKSLEHFPNCTKIASEYMTICRTLETRTATSAIKGHLYKLFRAVFDTGRYNDIREQLAGISWTSTRSTLPAPVSSSGSQGGDKETYLNVLNRFQGVVDAIRARLQDDRNAGLLNETIENLDVRPDEKSDEYLRRLNIPYSRCQPYIRPIQASSLSSSQHLSAGFPSNLPNTLPSDFNPSNPRGPDVVKSDGPDVFYGPVQCANPQGCLNSGAAKCRWMLCKTCCAEKTGSQKPDLIGAGVDGSVVIGQVFSAEVVCEVHAARAKLEFERKAFKAEKRKKKLSLTEQRNVKACPPQLN